MKPLLKIVLLIYVREILALKKYKKANVEAFTDIIKK
jgi:hypothetical protein